MVWFCCLLVVIDLNFYLSKPRHRFVSSTTLFSSYEKIKNPVRTRKYSRWDRMYKTFCGATRLWRIITIRPLYAYRHMQTFVYGESCSVSHTEAIANCLFCSPSEVHSATLFTLQSHHLQLSVENNMKLTYSSSTVYVIHYITVSVICQLVFKNLFVNYFPLAP